jgi:hypothetical protein
MRSKVLEIMSKDNLIQFVEVEYCPERLIGGDSIDGRGASYQGAEEWKDIPYLTNCLENSESRNFGAFVAQSDKTTLKCTPWSKRSKCCR